jgi:hypothetical protein
MLGERVRELVGEVIATGHLADLGFPADDAVLSLIVVADADVDLTAPQSSLMAELTALFAFDQAEPWARIASAAPEGINVAGYPLAEGGNVLILGWSKRSASNVSDPAISLSASPSGVHFRTGSRDGMP